MTVLLTAALLLTTALLLTSICSSVPGRPSWPVGTRAQKSTTAMPFSTCAPYVGRQAKLQSAGRQKSTHAAHAHELAQPANLAAQLSH